MSRMKKRMLMTVGGWIAIGAIWGVCVVAERAWPREQEIRRKFWEFKGRYKVAVLYQRVTDGVYYLNRSVRDVINILKETKADFIFLGWWRWHPIPQSPDERPGFYTSREIEEATRRGLTYEHLRDAIAEIKNESPDILFCGFG